MPVILVLEAEMGGSQMKPGSRRRPCCLKDKHQIDFSCRINHALHLSFCFLWGYFFKWSLCVPSHLSESGVVSFLHLAMFLKMGRTTTAVWAPCEHNYSITLSRSGSLVFSWVHQQLTGLSKNLVRTCISWTPMLHSWWSPVSPSHITLRT